MPPLKPPRKNPGTHAMLFVLLYVWSNYSIHVSYTHELVHVHVHACISYTCTCNMCTLASILQDFPSIYQVREKLIENDIITVFAVADEGNATVTQDLYSVSECVCVSTVE